MDEKLPLVSIQILNWNRADETQLAIKSAYDQTYPNCEVVLVDNGSIDNSIELSRANFPDLKIVRLDKNYGCPGGRNKGIPYCNGDFIFFADNDGIIHRQAVENAMKVISTSNSVGIVTGKVYDFSALEEVNTTIELVNKKSSYTNNFQGGICLHRKSMYDKTGLYPFHFMYGAEEMYLAIKAIDNNYSIIKDESVVLWHKKGLISRNNKDEIISKYFNKLYLAIVLFPIFDAILFFLYFYPFYQFYAIKEGMGLYFLYSIFSRKFYLTLKLAISHRNPISRNSFRRYRSI